MKTKYFYNTNRIPLQIPVIFEKNNFIVWTSEKLAHNHYFIYISKNYFFILNKFLKNELFLNFSFLIENSAIDTLNYLNINNSQNLFFKNKRFLLFYTYYFYNIKTKITFLLNCEKNNKTITSIDTIFNNAGWLERETSEMYGIYFIWKTDVRKLLLDYSKNDSPLLKDYPVSGYQDYFYNILEDTVSFYNNEVIQL